MINAKLLILFSNIIFIVVLTFEDVNTTPANENHQCYNQRYKQYGICRTLIACEKVLNDLIERDLLPQDCGYKGKGPTVCCPAKSFTNIPVNKPRFGNSKELCAEYAKSVFPFTYPSLNVGPPTKDTSLCADTIAEFIYGGSPASLAEFPHMALVGYAVESEIPWLCGGSLITDQWVLTAAHCAYIGAGAAKFVRLGELDFMNNTDGAETQDFEVIEIHQHPDYTSTSTYNDIALLKLNQKAKFTKYVRPACLWTEYRIPTEKVIATGWGDVVYLGHRSTSLLKVTLTLKTHAECDPWFQREDSLERGIDDSQQICAGVGAGEDIKDTCQGDSGGPLQIYADADFKCMYYIVGITSFGKPCGITPAPGVYARVSKFIPWIESIILAND